MSPDVAEQWNFTEMTELEHRRIHEMLHDALEELWSDFVLQHPESLSANITVSELLRWSRDQIYTPTLPQCQATTEV